MKLKHLSFVLLCTTNILSAAVEIKEFAESKEKIRGSHAAVVFTNPLATMLPGSVAALTGAPKSNLDEVSKPEDLMITVANPLRPEVHDAEVTIKATHVLRYVLQQAKLSPLSPPQEVLTFLVSAGLAYGTTVGTWRDIVQSTYPTLGLSTELEDYTGADFNTRLLIWGNLIAFHAVQIPTYYEIFEPYVRSFIKKVFGVKVTLTPLEVTGNIHLRRGLSTLSGIRSIADGLIDLSRYVGNTYGLMRNMLTYPLFFTGMALETLKESQKLEGKVLGKLPGYSSEHSKAIRDELLKKLSVAYNAVYLCKDSEKIEALFNLYRENKDLELFERLMTMASEESLDETARPSTLRKIGRYGTQTLVGAALIPLWMTTEYTLHKLIQSEGLAKSFTGALVGLRTPRAIMAAGEAYDYVAGSMTGYELERKTGIRIPADYISAHPVSRFVGNTAYYTVLALPMLMTFYVMSTLLNLDTPELVLGMLAMLFLESIVKQPVVTHLTEFNNRVFQGDRIISEAGNTEYLGLGGVYNLGVGSVNLLRGHTLTIEESDYALAKASKHFGNWLLAGERLTSSPDDSVIYKVGRGAANFIRHLDISEPFEHPFEEEGLFQRGVNRVVDALNYVLYRPDLTEGQEHQNQLLGFIRQLSEKVSVATEGVIREFDKIMRGEP